MADNEKRDLNPGQADYDRRFNELRRTEENGDFDTIADNYDQTADPSQENANIERARQGEQSGGWKQNFTGANTQSKDDGGRFKFMKKTPLAALIAIIFGGGFGIAGIIGGPSLLLVQISETFTGDPRLNTQLTSMTVETDKMLASKFQESTSGFCGQSVAILCKFTRPSNYLLKQMKANNIVALDSTGAVIEPNSNPFPNKRPATLQFTDSSGNKHEFDAADLLSKLNSDPSFRAAFRAAYNPRFVSLADKVFGTIKARFGFSGKDDLKDTPDSKTATDDLEKTAAGEDVGAKAAASEGDSAMEGILKKILGEKVTAMLQKLAQSGKGDAIGLAAGVACMATDIPGVIVKAVRSYQMVQFIKYASVFLIVAGAIKAGDATPVEVAALGSILTAVVSKKSAMDSFGIHNAFFGDTSYSSNSWMKFSPGASVMQNPVLNQMEIAFDSSAKKSVCTIAGNPVTGAGINVALAPETLGLGTLANVGAGYALSGMVDALAGPITDAAINLVPKEVFTGLMESLSPDLTNIAGEDVGNALASGAENMMSQTANAGGNMPLSYADAVAYGNVTDQVALAYAQEDRATLSPLDASNPNTALGSFVNQFMPYTSDLSSPSGIFSMLGSLVTSPLSLLSSATASAASSPTNLYNQCQDPEIQASSTAATAFCAIDYGIPTKYLNSLTPTEVVNDLTQSGDIDADGNPTDNSVALNISNAVFGTDANDQSTLKNWMDLCTDGTTDAISGNSNDCEITNKKTAEYAVYTILHRVQQTMDGEDSSVLTGAPTANANPSVSNTTNTPNGNIVVGTGGDSGGNGTTPSGANVVQYSKLVGANFSDKINSAGAKNFAALPSGSYTFNDFAFGVQGKSGTSAQGLNAYGAVLTNQGLLGAGSKYTSISMVPGTSTKADYVPPEKATGSANARTNQLQYILVTGTPSYTIDGVKIVGTNQGHLYNGLMLNSVPNVSVSNTTVTSVPGNDSGPPGETFEINLYNLPKGGTANFTNVTADGSKVAAVGIGLNSIKGTVTMRNVLTENTAYSAGIAGWQMSGTDNYYNWVSTNNIRNYNAERHSGTSNFYDPVWDQPTAGHYDINYTWESGWSGGSINFYFTNQAAWNNYIANRSTKKITIVTNSHGQGNIRSTVHVYVGGVEQPQANYVQFSGTP